MDEKNGHMTVLLSGNTVRWQN